MTAVSRWEYGAGWGRAAALADFKALSAPGLGVEYAAVPPKQRRDAVEGLPHHGVPPEDHRRVGQAAEHLGDAAHQPWSVEVTMASFRADIAMGSEDRLASSGVSSKESLVQMQQ